jgi:hypothetical protein
MLFRTMTSNFINVEKCVPVDQKKAVICTPSGFIVPNEIVLADNINNAFLKLQQAIQHFEDSSCILEDYIEYYGWLGVLPNSLFSEEALANNCNVIKWQDIEEGCLSVPPTGVTWEDLECRVGENIDCKTYVENWCARTNCFGKYCMDWSWKKLTTSQSELPITWRRTKEGESHAKVWEFEECDNDNSVGCNEGNWNVNIPYIDEYYDPLKACTNEKRCIYTGVASRENIIYATRSTSVCVLSSDYESTLIGARHTLDSSIGFKDLCGIAIDSKNNFFVIDRVLCRVAVYSYKKNTTEPWTLENIWGEPGPRAINNRFFRPNDIHIDKHDTVWVPDTGNNCVKQYTNTGNWIQTLFDNEFLKRPPLSVGVDEADKVHILVENAIRVYSYEGSFLFEYSIDVTSPPKKINTNYNRQIIYVTYETCVKKYTRVGLPFKNLFEDNRFCGTGVGGIYQDEYRNVLVLYGDKILKFVHILKQKNTKSIMTESFWNTVSKIFIDRDEYVQDWVYNKAFQRMWDAIEAFRSSLFYDTTYCKGYRPPIFQKHEVCIGQNEPVTSIVINRCLENLWANLCSVVSYYDPECKEPVPMTQICESPTIEWNTQVYPVPANLGAEDIWSVTSDNLKATFRMGDTCGGNRTVYGSASAIITTKNCEAALEISLTGRSIRTLGSNEQFTVYINNSAILVAIPPLNSPILLNNYQCTTGPVNVYQRLIPKILLTPQTTYKLIAETTTFTSIAHKDSYYEVKLNILV